MEGDDGPSAISSKPTIIKAAQEQMGRLDVLVCGQCHSVFHFIEEFQEHRTKEGACSKVSHFRENNDNGQKAQVWAFLLWKDSQTQPEGSDKDATNAWKLYQKWCKMDMHVRDSWIAAGKTIQTFTKISNAKMQDTPIQVQTNTNVEGAKPIIVRKIIRNGQPDETNEAKKDTTKLPETKTQKNESVEMETDKKEKPKLKPSIKPKNKSGKAAIEDAESSNEEYVVEKILAKRFNPKKRCSEFLIKWEGCSHENNTWESAEAVSTCKNMLEEFERNLAKQKELKAAQQQTNTKVVGRASLPAQKPVIKAEVNKPGPSTATQAGRPMRSSKSKAMDQVKQWCGSMKEEDNELLGKRRMHDSESESDDGESSAAKRTKVDTGSDDEWTGESDSDSRMGRSDVIQRAFSRANAQSNGSNRASVSSTDLATSLGLQSPEGAKSSQPPVLVANAKGVVKVDPKQMPNLTSGVYVMSRKDGIIKLDSSPSGKLAVKGSPTTQGVLMVQNRDNIARKQSNSMTPAMKVVSKMDGSQVVTQMKVVTSKPITAKTPGSVQKTEPIKIQPKPDPSQLQQIHVVTAMSGPIALQPRITTGIRPTSVTPQRTADGRPLLPRPALRATTATSVLGTIRTPVRAPAPRQIQTPTTRPVLHKRATTTVINTQSVSPSTTGTPVAQIRPKFTVLTTPAQSKQVIKTGTSPVQQTQMKQSPKTPVGKAQSLLSPQQKLLMAKRKAQEAAGIIKPGGRGLLAGARAGATAGRGRAKVGETSSAITQAGAKFKESKLAEGDGLHMEFHEVGSEESSSDGEPDLPPPPESDAITALEPDSPPRPFTLCPLTGRIIGPDGEPIEQAAEQPEPEPTASPSNTTTLSTAMKTTTTVSETTIAADDVTAATTTTSTTSTTTTTTTDADADAAAAADAELVLPSLDSLTESGIMRVEMSPGGTTGTIVQTSETTAQINLSNVTVPAPDLPCLDDTAPTIPAVPAVPASTPLTENTTSPVETSITTALSAVTAATSTVTMSVTSADAKTDDKISEERKVTTDDASNLVTLAEHGVVYQVAGQAEDGQTLLVTRDADGEQQIYVTTEQQGDDGSVLTFNHAVAEAVAQLIPDQVNLTPQFYVKEDGAEPTENSMVMSIMDNANATDVTGAQEDNDGQAQVVAQVVQAEEPTPGGTRRVVLLLSDGNFMMTEVDEEQYAALELDKKTESIASSVSQPKRNISKTELRKTILIAVPNSVEFHNYESNKLYRKVVVLQNVSTSLARFQLAARPIYSRFTVMIECKRQMGSISPGMHVKLIILFRCDILDEPKEMLIINVQQGRSVIIKLRGYRDSPILRMTTIPYFPYPRKQLQAKAMIKDEKWIAEIPFTQTNSCEKFTDTSSNAGESRLYCKKLKSFDCGECLVDQQVISSLMVKNVGGEGRFFIMSEIDWCSMHIEDVTNDNMLILSSFAMWPAYFTLKPQEHIYLYIYFFPNTHGMHIETLYAICDNCSVITTEVIGDGVVYKQQ